MGKKKEIEEIEAPESIEDTPVAEAPENIEADNQEDIENVEVPENIVAPSDIEDTPITEVAGRYKSLVSITYNGSQYMPGEILPEDINENSLKSLISNGFVELI